MARMFQSVGNRRRPRDQSAAPDPTPGEESGVTTGQTVTVGGEGSEQPQPPPQPAPAPQPQPAPPPPQQ